MTESCLHAIRIIFNKSSPVFTPHDFSYSPTLSDFQSSINFPRGKFKCCLKKSHILLCWSSFHGQKTRGEFAGWRGGRPKASGQFAAFPPENWASSGITLHGITSSNGCQGNGDSPTNAPTSPAELTVNEKRWKSLWKLDRSGVPWAIRAMGRQAFLNAITPATLPALTDVIVAMAT